ncbi:hypothetical protein O181_011828 [Austropuccinia psidii MF-1]|uniref:Uncharacterized protein n=1 Tax=Austropuccinia psidii MF-1 TaxID=1389203 RepID=A0A9Q3BVL7_9BASI|nr:hypothetical protein [Austropuccinia psidii MF-1]
MDDLWNKRLGHPGKHSVNAMRLPSSDQPCKVCDLSKEVQIPFKDHFKDAILPLDFICIYPVGGNSVGHLELVDETQFPEGPTDNSCTPVTSPCHCHIKVIGTRNPTLVTADISKANILPYSHWEGALVTIAADAPQTYKKLIEGDERVVWTEIIARELQ